MRELNKKEQERHHINHVVNVIRYSSNNNEDIKRHYEHWLEQESDLSSAGKKYFRNCVFGKIPYSETKKKMQELMTHDLALVSFEGKEFQNIQKFLRETKLNNIR